MYCEVWLFTIGCTCFFFYEVILNSVLIFDTVEARKLKIQFQDIPNLDLKMNTNGFPRYLKRIWKYKYILANKWLPYGYSSRRGKNNQIMFMTSNKEIIT